MMRLPHGPRLRLPVLLALLAFGAPVAAQTGGSPGGLGTASPDSTEAPVVIPPPRPGSLEARAFYAVYDAQNPLFVATMRSANGASMPLFIAAVPLSGLTVLATGESGGPTGRLALSELGALGLVAAAKLAVNRARPFATLPDVTPRQRKPPGGLDPYSFPSGHSAMAFALATSTSLSYPEWYVIAPAYVWASTTALARVWFGMHYTSDVVAGAAAGAGVAVLVHLLLDSGGGDALPEDASFVPAVPCRVGL